MSMSQLNTYLNNIKTEKETNLIPENIIFGKEILGVQGGSKFSIEVDFENVVTTQNSLMYFITKVNGLNFLKYSGTSLTSLFAGYNNLSEASIIELNNITNLSYMFNNCSKLKKVNLSKTQNVTNMYNMFSGCTLLEDISEFSTKSVTNISGMFTGCISLTNASLNNILQMCINATSYTGTKTLATIGLTSTQATTCQGLSNYSSFTSAGWSTGY